jgi:uncharacterized Zn finger protein (UPF0148 family)
MTTIYCPFCGTTGEIKREDTLVPGDEEITCPNCETKIIVSMEFKEVE